MIYLDLEDLLYVAERTLGGPANVRGMGLLNSVNPARDTLIDCPADQRSHSRRRLFRYAPCSK
jgi:hypothetical protein